MPDSVPVPTPDTAALPPETDPFYDPGDSGCTIAPFCPYAEMEWACELRAGHEGPHRMEVGSG